MRNPFLSNQNIFEKITKKKSTKQQINPTFSLPPNAKFSFGKIQQIQPFKINHPQPKQMSNKQSVNRRQFDINPKLNQYVYQQNQLNSIQNILQQDIILSQTLKYTPVKQKQDSIFTISQQLPWQNRLSSFNYDQNQSQHFKVNKQPHQITPYKDNEYNNISGPKKNNLVIQNFSNQQNLPNIPISPLTAKNKSHSFLDLDLYDIQMRQFLAMTQNRQQLIKLLGLNRQRNNNKQQSVKDSTKEVTISQKKQNRFSNNFFTKNKNTLSKNQLTNYQSNKTDDYFNFNEFKQEEDYQQQYDIFQVPKYQPEIQYAKHSFTSHQYHPICINQQSIELTTNINLVDRIGLQMTKNYIKNNSRLILTCNQKIIAKKYQLHQQ